MLICLKFQIPTKMAGHLTVQERAQIAARYWKMDGSSWFTRMASLKS